MFFVVFETVHLLISTQKLVSFSCLLHFSSFFFLDSITLSSLGFQPTADAIPVKII